MSELPPSNDDDAAKSIRVTTGARLHFGLLDTVAPFGGIGVMLREPQTEVLVTRDREFCCRGPHCERVTQIALRLVEKLKLQRLPSCKIEFRRVPPPHSGLGSGTQIAMSVAEALCRFMRADLSPITLATCVANRGHRSAVGVHGYLLGGLIHESSVKETDLNPIRNRVELPPSWAVALFTPVTKHVGVSGGDEIEKFSKLSTVPTAVRKTLAKIIDDTILPAAQTGDFDRFAQAVQDYNRQSGQLFAAVQDGPYNGPDVTRTVHELINLGASGVGQSSWGPTVFAWFENSVDATLAIKQFPSEIATGTQTSVRNEPRSILVM